MRRFSDIIKILMLPLVGASAVVGLSGCNSTAYVPTSFEALKPAYYTIPKWVDTLLFVRCVPNVTYTDTSLYMPNKKLAASVATFERNMPSLLLQLLNNEVMQSGYMPIKIYNRPMEYGSLRQWSDSLLRVNGAGAMLVLKDFDYSEHVSVTSGRGEVDCNLFTCVKSSFEYVNRRGQRMSLVERNDTLLWSFTGDNHEEVARNLPTYNVRGYDVVAAVAANYADLLVPKWQIVHRMLMVSGDADMVRASTLFSNGDYAEAENLWLKKVEKGSVKDKVRAAMNMALLKEKADNAEEASKWCSMALDFLQNKRCKDMEDEKRMAEAWFGILVRRMAEKEILNKQM